MWKAQMWKRSRIIKLAKCNIEMAVVNFFFKKLPSEKNINNFRGIGQDRLTTQTIQITV